MDNKERVNKLIGELQDLLASGWNVESVSVSRAATTEGKKVFVLEIEIIE